MARWLSKEFPKVPTRLRRSYVPLRDEIWVLVEERAKKERRTVANLLSGIIEDEFLKGQDD